MAYHFLRLYLLIVITLAAVSWGQERLLQMYGRQSSAQIVAENPSQTALFAVVEEQLRRLPREKRARFVRDLAAKTHVDLDLLDSRDIAGGEALERLAHGGLELMSEADGRTWMLKGLIDDGRVLAFRYSVRDTQRTPLEWLLAILFYAAIALVLMSWLWPLRRDLRRLEKSTTNFGNRNWAFDADIKSSSQVYPLAQAFRRMAARIDSLIGSHKDMSNAVSHEIKTPLARMRFEIEMARAATNPEGLAGHLNNINTDIKELNAFVTAALDYAILERAEVALNIAEHDFTLILPAVTESIRSRTPSALNIQCEVQSTATRVSCDAHLIETVLRNLLYNAIRYARTTIRVTFVIQSNGVYGLCVDDDGPGIPAADRGRVFGSFVQLDQPSGTKVGYGLGLAIVLRVTEWHGGTATVSQSSLGGARFAVEWPVGPTTAAVKVRS
jgi:two-component system OmpR family sensor kinase